MGCVNKSSKEFKDLAARNNLADNTLELITHKYWLETGNETLFPTDVYIQAQLGNTQYQESGKSVRELWEKMYSTPQEFHSLSELQAARKEASRFFPQSAIVHYKNAMGNYVLSVKRPVEQANYDKDDFFNEFDNIDSMRDIKKLNLDIIANQTYTISKVQELYNRFNDDRTSKALADKVFNIAKDLGIEVSFNETLPFGTIGRYTNSNTITYKKSFLERDIMTNKKASIILHEVLHSISMYALSNKTENWKRPETLQEFHTEINSLYQDLKNNPLLKGERGIVDAFEFVAELANPVFRDKIQEIDKQTKANKSFWSRILDAFKSLLGIHTSDTYYQRSMNALDKALNAFDIDTYMRYNGIKSQLRKEVANNTINQTNQRLENKKLVKYDKAIKSAGRLFLQIYRSLQEGEQKYRRENEGKTNEGKSLRERGYEEAARQQRQLLDWAERNHQLIYEPNDYYDDIFNDQSLHGTESKVWIDQKKGVVIKNVSPNHYQNIKALLYRIAIHNIAFPSTAMTLKKIGTSDKGISLIIEQPLIEDSDNIPTLQEIQNYMTNTLGFTLSKGKGINAEYTKDGYLVTDIRPENVIKQPDGSLAVIDCFAKFEDESMGNNIMGDVENQAQRFIDSMSSSQLKDETDLIKQESADYDLVNDIESKPEHSGKPVPQDFTFADGTKVKAPFKPNAQQVDALNEMDRFMKSNETSMTLSGYAGTGKTSLMEMIAQKGRKQYRSVVFCATTNKAAAVLNERVSKAGFKAATLNKVFGISVEVDSKSNTYNARNLVNVLKDADITPGTTVIIDEASMINEENYNILNNIAKQNDLKIIYVGDSAQLAPVGEDKISKVFRNGEGKVITLTQVERTDDNAILKEATELRNGNPLSGISSFNDKGEGVAYISPNHQDEINNVVAHYVKGLKHNSNYFRILAFTNKAVSAYNNQVRELLGYTSPIPQVDEPMTGYNNWGYEWKTKSYRFINSESYKVSKVDKSHKITTNLNDGTVVTMEVIPLTLEDSLGNIDTFNFIDIKSNPSNLQAAIQLANEKKMLWAEAKHAVGKDAKAKIYQRINFIDNFLFVNDNIEDSNHNLLQAKTIDFGYAMTVHKSQGSTFINVLMDDVDISRAGLNSNNAMEVVDLGEIDNNVASSANFTGDAEDVDLGFSNDFSTSSTEPTKHSAPTQTINLKQQLEYVGVSRATDTVTIVSNNIKKEGSPLHPTKEVKEDKVNSNTTRLNITPANSIDKKAAIKGAMANKFIGFADGIFNSSTGKYAQQAGDKANTGNYTSNDVVFVSIPGKRGNEEVRHQQQDRTIAEALKALKAGATLLTDNKAYTENSTYNEGEKRLAKALNDAGAVYSKIQKDNQTIGVWTISTNNSRSNNKIENNESNNTRNAETVAGKQQTSNGGLLAESQARIQRGDGNLRETQEQGVLSQEDIDKRNQEDRESLEKFAKEQGKWADDVDTKLEKKYGGRIGHGSEAWVYRKDKDTVIKSRSITGYNTVSDALRSIELHNTLFPETAMKVVGFGNGDGEFSIIIEQPFIEGAYTSQEEIDSFVKERFNAEKDPSVIGNTSYKTDDYLLQDLKPQNVLVRIVNGERQYNVIDGDFYNTPPTTPTEPTTHTTPTKLTTPTNGTESSTVSLPSYEYFNDLYEDTPVDAAWKIPYLKELDAQISDENSIEDNKNIINRMDNILQSTSEKEYLQESKNSEKKQVEKTLDEYDKLNRQIDNLLGNQDLESDGEVYHLDELGVAHLSASEIRHTAELVANEISDSITKLQKEEGLAEKLFPTLKTDLDFKSASRKQIVEAVGINRLIDSVKSIFDTEANWDSYKDDENGISFQADLIFANWDAIMYLAADVFAMNEGFGIAKDFSKGNFTTTDDSHIDYDNFNDYSNDQDIAAEEGEKDDQEHWQIENRTIDVLNSMSALVRQGIHECYLLNADSSKVMSKWGIAERVNPREAVNSILRWTQGSLSLNDMIKKLSNKQSQNPWLSQLVQRLSDKSGNETDFQSQFYGVFSKHFQPYSVVLLEDGKYHSIAVNSHPALTDVMNTITSQFKIGEHPLFGINGKVNTKLLGSANSVSNDFTLHKALSELQNIDKSIKQGNTLDDKMSKVVSNNIMAVCRAFGYNITEDMLSGVVNAESINKVTSALNFIVKDLDSAASAQHKGEMKDYNPFAFGTKFGINGSLRNFLTPITDKLEDTAVNAFYDSGKMYQSYVTPSFMTKLFNKFRQEGQAFEDFILDEYGSSEWFKFGAGDGDITKGWRNEWLRLLARDENARKVFDHKVELNFNKHNYMRNMSDAEYTLSLITEYFSESAKVEDRVPAWYRGPCNLISLLLSSSSSTLIEVTVIRMLLLMVFITCSYKRLVEYRLSLEETCLRMTLDSLRTLILMVVSSTSFLYSIAILKRVLFPRELFSVMRMALYLLTIIGLLLFFRRRSMVRLILLLMKRLSLVSLLKGLSVSLWRTEYSLSLTHGKAMVFLRLQRTLRTYILLSLIILQT
jgi:exodeoxyribonuclease-5